MAVGIADLPVLTFPILAGEASTTGTAVPVAPGLFSFVGGPVMVALDSTDDWRVRIVRPPAMTVIADIASDPDPTVARTFDESHEIQANELGSLAFSTWDADAVTALVEVGDLVEFHERGLCTGGGVIRQAADTKVSISGEAKPWTRWSGVRPIGVLEEGVIRPARAGAAGVYAYGGLGSLAQDRIWGWFGIDYDDDSWGTATQIVRQDQASTYWTGLPTEWHDTTAYWVWAARRAGNPPLDQWSPEGFCLFRDTFAVPAGVLEVEVELAARAIAELYIEGELEMTTNATNADPDEVTRKRIPVRAGTNLLAVNCVNNPDPEGDEVANPAGVLWAVWTVNPATGERGTVLAHSDSSALILEYPANRPGVTPGVVLLGLLEEFQALGYFPWVTATFTRELDSAGSPWAEVGEIGTKCGYSFWKLVQQLVAVYIDTDMTPGTNEWHAWSKGTRGRTSGVAFVSPTGADPATGNLRGHVVTTTLRRANVVLSYSSFGWHEHSFVSPGARRIDGTLGLGAVPSEEAVDRYARAELAESDQDRNQHEVSMLPTSDADKPLWAYDIGDTVTIDGAEQPVEAISWRRDRQGRIQWD